MTAVGAVFLPQCPPELLRGAARAADEAGLAELWLWEDCFRQSGVASAAAALALAAAGPSQLQWATADVLTSRQCAVLIRGRR